jgi:hypothetical protein
MLGRFNAVDDVPTMDMSGRLDSTSSGDAGTGSPSAYAATAGSDDQSVGLRGLTGRRSFDEAAVRRQPGEDLRPAGAGRGIIPMARIFDD